MSLHILHHKSWHVWNEDNMQKVREDEKKHKMEMEQKRCFYLALNIIPFQFSLIFFHRIRALEAESEVRIDALRRLSGLSEEEKKPEDEKSIYDSSSSKSDLSGLSKLYD